MKVLCKKILNDKWDELIGTNYNGLKILKFKKNERYDVDLKEFTYNIYGTIDSYLIRIDKSNGSRFYLDNYDYELDSNLSIGDSTILKEHLKYIESRRFSKYFYTTKELRKEKLKKLSEF